MTLGVTPTWSPQQWRLRHMLCPSDDVIKQARHVMSRHAHVIDYLTVRVEYVTPACNIGEHGVPAFLDESGNPGYQLSGTNRGTQGTSLSGHIWEPRVPAFLDSSAFFIRSRMCTSNLNTKPLVRRMNEIRGTKYN